jgi:hypothetical protein
MPASRWEQPGVGSVVRAGTIAGLIAGILCSILWAIGALFGTEFEVQPPGSDDLRDVTLPLVLLTPVLVGAIVSAVAAFLFRGPGAFLWVLLLGFVLTIISLGLPLFQPSGVTWPTRLWLVSMHLVTGLVIVPVVALAVAGRTLSQLVPRSSGPMVVQGEVIDVEEVIVHGELPEVPPGRDPWADEYGQR